MSDLRMQYFSTHLVMNQFLIKYTVILKHANFHIIERKPIFYDITLIQMIGNWSLKHLFKSIVKNQKPYALGIGCIFTGKIYITPYIFNTLLSKLLSMLISDLYQYKLDDFNNELDMFNFI